MSFLELRNICKNFAGVHALHNVSCTINLGEVVGLVGDNGAGKSTLIKIISGNFPATSGQIFVEQNEVKIDIPEQANQLGIEVAYQDLGLAPNLNAIENIFLGREERYFNSIWSPIKYKSMRAQTVKLLHRLQSDSPIDQPIASFSGGQRQAVAIARTLREQAKLVIMDEPLAAISIRQVKEVLDLIRTLKNQGKGVLLISHRLDDIFAVCDRIIILRRGELITEGEIATFTPQDVTGYITGAIG